ncbi:hypothetical protein [Streptomyces sp. NPDC023838]|uniref:hypothetical protein n=1 Tax=Streptomyces sp. NPDC023838 TaxID=3154325 RepID=UPI0033FCCE57
MLFVDWWYKPPVKPPAPRLDPSQVATTTYNVTAMPVNVGWSLRVESVGRTTCSHMGEIETAARELIVSSLGMPPERVLINIIVS